MAPSLRKAMLWQVVGVGLYLVGMLLFLGVALGTFLAPPENSFANATLADGAAMLASVAMIVAGRTVSYKLGGESGVVSGVGDAMRPGRDRNKLEELGYRMPPESPAGADSDEGSGFSYEDGDLRVVCGECGAENDPDFRFCGNCSAELPD